MSWPDNFTSGQGVTSPYADISSLVTDNDSGNTLGSPLVDINDSDLPPNKPHLLYWYYISGLAGTAIALFGLVGNTVSIAILTHRTMRNSTSVLLIFMGVFDNVFLLLNLLLQTFPFIFVKHNICPEYIHVRQFLFKVSAGVANKTNHKKKLKTPESFSQYF